MDILSYQIEKDFLCVEFERVDNIRSFCCLINALYLAKSLSKKS